MHPDLHPPVRPQRQAVLQPLLRLGVGLALAATSLLSVAGAKKSPAPAYTYAAVGDPQRAAAGIVAPASASLVLMGGGPDVDEAFRWMIARAGIRPGTGGRFVVIRATGTDAYNPYIYYSDAAGSTTQAAAEHWVGGAALGLSSVETLVIPSRAAADDAFVNSVVARADALFIAGGDQGDYIRYWKGTRLDATLRDLLGRHAPLGGTSAGLAVLGQFDYTGVNGSVTSTQALGDPYHKSMTFDPSPFSLTGGFLTPSELANTILDSHLDTRDRMGRLIAFVSRTVKQNGSTGCAGGLLKAGSDATGTARAIGIGVEAALLVERSPTSPHTVTARRVTNPSTTTESAVWFVRPLNPPTTCASRKPLTVTDVEIRKLADSQSLFNLTDWLGGAGRSVDAINGKLTSAPY